MAARSERLAAAARQPKSWADIVASLKWTVSTRTSVLTTTAPGKIAASSASWPGGA